MFQSPFAVDIALPDDLANQFSELATKPVPARSTVATLVVEGTSIAATAISFLQGPPAVAYWVDVTKRWLGRKRENGVYTLKIEGPAGTAHIKVTKDTDLAQLAAALHTALFPNAATANSHDTDDIAL